MQETYSPSHSSPWYQIKFSGQLHAAPDLSPQKETLLSHLTLRRLMSYIYIYIYIYMEHPFLMFLDHTQRRSTVSRTSSGRVISSSQRPLPDNTRHSQETNIHAPGGIRTQDLSRRAAWRKLQWREFWFQCSRVWLC